MGAEWVGSAGAVPDLLTEASAKVREAPGGQLWRTACGLRSLEELPGKTGDLIRRIQTLRGEDRSLHDALKRCSDARLENARELLLAYVEGFHAADPGRLSAQWLETVEKNQPAEAWGRRSLDGTERVVEALRSQLGEQCSFQLDSIVREVRWKRGEVIARVSRRGNLEEFHAQAAVVTFPLPILKAPPDHPASVRFGPDLSAKHAALARLEMGPAIKLVLRFHEPFCNRSRSRCWQGGPLGPRSIGWARPRMRRSLSRHSIRWPSPSLFPAEPSKSSSSDGIGMTGGGTLFPWEPTATCWSAAWTLIRPSPVLWRTRFSSREKQPRVRATTQRWRGR